eukprot:5305254-Pyramimonas_sp.AAC.1
MAPVQRKWDHYPLQVRARYSLDFSRGGRTARIQWNLDALVRRVVGGLWRARFLKEMEAHF